MDKHKCTSGYKLASRSREGLLVGYGDSDKMFSINFARKHKVDTVRPVKFQGLSHTAVVVHTPPLPRDLADNTTTTNQELPPEIPPPVRQTIISSTQQTLPESDPEMPVQFRHPALIELTSAATNIQDYLEVSDDERELESDSVATNPVAGAATPHHNTSTSTASAPKSSKTAFFDEVPQSPKLNHDSYAKGERTQTRLYSEHKFARLVAEPTTYKQGLACPDVDTSQSSILVQYQAIQEART